MSDELARYLQNNPNLVVERIGDKTVLHRPQPDIRRVYVEVTTRCNLDCQMCVRRAWRDAPGDMTWETFGTVMAGLRPLAEVGVLKRVTFGGFGESLLHPQILDMAAAVGSLGVGVTLTTNGLLLHPPLIEALVVARVDTIVISLDAMHADAAREQGLNGSWQAILANIRYLRDFTGRQKLMVPRLAFECVATRSGIGEIAAVMALAKEVGAAYVIVSHLLPYTQDMIAETLYDSDRPLPVPAGWPVVSGDYVTWGTAKMPRMKWGAARRCRFVAERAMVIGWDGGVSPCYALMHSYPYYVYAREKNVVRYVLGNVREAPLGNIWMCRDYVLFRSKVEEFRFPSCVDCGMACSFTRNNDDCWGNSPSCADCLWAQDIVRCP